MAMLHELAKPGCIVLLKKDGERYTWNRSRLVDWRGKTVGTCIWTIHDTNWELDEPTVDDVLRERGFEICDATDGQFWLGTEDERFLILLQQRPTTAAETTRIIDFLESLNK